MMSNVLGMNGGLSSVIRSLVMIRRLRLPLESPRDPGSEPSLGAGCTVCLYLDATVRQVVAKAPRCSLLDQ